jgi:thymidylate synthase (FAD)
MQAKLIAHTQLTHRIHAGERDHNGLDNIQDLIAYCARVSNPNNQANTKTTPKLLEYLIKHKHWSPFEMASATIEVNTTRDIARQLLRHRSFSFQEFSQRYADIRDLSDSVVIRKARLQDLKNRQNGILLCKPISGQ